MKTRFTGGVIASICMASAYGGDGEAPEVKYMSDGPILFESKPAIPMVLPDEIVYFHGDVRYRLQYIDRDSEPSDFVHRLRVRVGMDARVNEKMYAEVQLATGSGDPVSTNQSLGDGFTSKDIRLDIGDIFYKGDDGWGRLGKFKNPHKSAMKNQLVWDSDLRPEGITGLYDIASAGTTLIAGIWIGSHEGEENDVYFYNAQVLQELTFGGLKLNGGAAYYGVPNMRENVTTNLADKDRANGNTVVDINGTSYYAYDYRMADFFAEAAMHDFTLSYEMVVNTAIGKGNFGYNAGIMYKNDALLKLRTGYFYRSTEADAVIGAFHDSDFMGGYTNSFGHQLMVGIDVMKNAQFALTYIDGAIRNGLGNDGGNERYRRLHVDFKVKFNQ